MSTFAILQGIETKNNHASAPHHQNTADPTQNSANSGAISPVGEGDEPEIKHPIMREFLSGVTAGLGIAVSTYPLEGAKKFTQLYPIGVVGVFNAEKKAFQISSAGMFGKILTQGRIGNFEIYRGLGVFALNIVPTTTVQLGTDAFLHSSFFSKDNSLSTEAIKSIVSGISGASTATVVENIIINQHALETDMKKAMVALWKDGGFSRFWKSYPFIATRDSIFTFFMLCLIPNAKSWARQNSADEETAKWNSRMTGVGLSIVGAVTSHPFDMIASRLQLIRGPETTKNLAPLPTGFMPSVKFVCEEIKNEFGGYKGFARGLPMRLGLFAAFSNGIPHIQEKAKKVYDTYVEGAVTSKPSLQSWKSANTNAAPASVSQTEIKDSDISEKRAASAKKSP